MSEEKKEHEHHESRHGGHHEHHKSNEEKTITIKKDDLWKYSTFVLIGVLIIGSIFLFTGNGNAVGNTGTSPTQPDTQPSVVSASVDDDAVLGDPNAPVTIIEFSDYECPFCGKFWAETLPSIKSNYIDTGQVKLVYRDFPLTSIHPLAQVSAEAAECVRDQGGDEAYFEYHDTIFGNQPSLTNSNLIAWANDLGYDIESCLNSGKFTGEVQKDLADAQASGGRGTPYFVILKSDSGSGTPLSGAYPFGAFEQVIEAELA